MMPEFDGSVLSAFADSVVAMMNYRVGVFGFLNLGDGDISGNMGLFDQVSWPISCPRDARNGGEGHAQLSSRLELTFSRSLAGVSYSMDQKKCTIIR